MLNDYYVCLRSTMTADFSLVVERDLFLVITLGLFQHQARMLIGETVVAEVCGIRAYLVFGNICLVLIGLSIRVSYEK